MEGESPKQITFAQQHATNNSDSKLFQLLKDSNVTLLGKEPIGRGNFGAVWKGIFSDQVVAVKVVEKLKLDELYLEVGVLQ